MGIVVGFARAGLLMILLNAAVSGLAALVGRLLPVGDEIAYISGSVPDSYQVDWMDVERGLQHCLICISGNVRQIEWSQDGDELALIADYEGGFDIFIFDVMNFKLRQVSDFNLAYSFDWSPDENYFAVNRFTNTKTAPLFLVNNADGTAVQITKAYVQENNFDWSPDGSKLVVAEYDLDNIDKGQIYIISPNNLDKVAIAPSFALSLQWSPDGNTILFQGISRNLSIVDLDTMTTGPLLLPLNLSITDASWSPNGQTIAFAANDRAAFKTGLYVLDIDGDQFRQLAAELDLYAAESPIWNSRGDRLIFQVTDQLNAVYPTWELLAVNTDGTHARQLTFNDRDEISTVWRPSRG